MLLTLLKMFDQGFLHWFTQRISACLLIVSIVILSASASNNVFLGLVIFALVLVHFETGIHTLISDYMHDSRSKLITNVSMDLLIISLTKTIFMFLICV
jgi:succinate dehydrogenase hydrophobic anchor subunit